MSVVSRILGIPGLEVERVVWNQGIDVWAKSSRSLSSLHCGREHLRIKAIYRRIVKPSTQGNPIITLHLKAPYVASGKDKAHPHLIQFEASCGAD